MSLDYPLDFKERFERFDHSDYRRFIFLASRGLQSSELNDLQSWIKYERKQYGNALFLTEEGRGEHLRGDTPSVNEDSGEVIIGDGLIYIDGEIHPVGGTRGSDVEKTNIISVVKGSDGGMDSLGFPSSQEVVSIDRVEWNSVDVGITNYSITGDFEIDWSSGATTEPTSGNSYLVEYTYTSVFTLPDDSLDYDIGIVLAQDIIHGGHSKDTGDYQTHAKSEKSLALMDSSEDTLQSIASDNRGKEGAHRLRVRAFWSYAERNSDGSNEDHVTPSDLEGAFNGNIDFYPLYFVSGFSVQNLAPPTADSIIQAVARYDRKANGSYIVNGFDVSTIEYPSGNQISNGGFGSDTTGWSAGGDNSGVANDLEVDSKTLKITSRDTATSAKDWAEQSFKVMEGSFYKVKGRYKSDAISVSLTSVSAANNTITVSSIISDALERDNKIKFVAPGIPAGVTEDATYYVKLTSSANVWTVYTDTGLMSALDITDSGTNPSITIIPEVSVAIELEDFPVTGGVKSVIIDGVNRFGEDFDTFEFDFQAPLIEKGSDKLVGISSLYEVREIITRGSTASDALNPPDEPASQGVYRIISVVPVEGSDTYIAGTDYDQYPDNLSASVGWLTDGSSPSEDDEYEVTYQYIISINNRPGLVANSRLTRVLDANILLRVSSNVSNSLGYFDDIEVYDLDEVGYQVSSGEAHVNGFEVISDNATRLVFDADPDLESADETRVRDFGDDSPFDFPINLFDTPIHSLKDIEITLRDTNTVTRGSTNSEVLPLAEKRTIRRIVSVNMGNTVYTEGIDWRKAINEDGENSEAVYWIATGSSPSNGEEYSVIFEYEVDSGNIVDTLNNPNSVQYEFNYEDYDDGGTTKYSVLRVIVSTDKVVIRLVENRDDDLTVVDATVSYDQKIPRIDRLALDQDGNIRLLRGVSHKFTPAVPLHNPELLSLATTELNWEDLPEVINDGVKVVPQNILQEMRDNIDDLFRLTSLDRLNVNVALRDSSVKHGVFADPFLDDRLRELDLGKFPQSAAISDGKLQLGISDNFEDFHLSDSISFIHSDEFTDVIQLKSTMDRVINPYTVFEVLPPRVFLSPSVDQWSDTNTVWLSAITREFTRTSGRGSRTTSERVVNRSTEVIRNARQITVDFTIEGFGTNEALGSIIFGANSSYLGGVFLPFSPVSADANGTLMGSFVVPSGHKTNNKYNVVFIGSGTTNPSIGLASYESRGSQITVVRQRTNTVIRVVPPPPPVREVLESIVRSVGVPTVVETPPRVVTPPPRVVTPPPRVDDDIGNENDNDDDGGDTDPLAQTFKLNRDRMVSGVRLWISDIGNTSNAVWVELVETSVGIPTREILRRSVVDGTSLTTTTPMDFTWEPVLLRANVEYAFVVKTDDSEHSVRVAELGKFDEMFGWVTRQAYQVGVLLSSSNARTWTPHQTEDMKFVVLGARYSQNDRTVPIGNVDLPIGTTELLVEADVDRPSLLPRGDRSTDVKFRFVSGGVTHEVEENRAIRLDSAISGVWALSARLSGPSNRLSSPSVDQDISVISGVLQTEGVYVTKEFNADSGDKITVVLEQDIPGTSTLKVEYQNGVNSSNVPVWVVVDQNPDVDDVILDNGFIEREYLSVALTRTKSRIRITLTGTAKDRPGVRNLRGFTKA